MIILILTFNLSNNEKTFQCFQAALNGENWKAPTLAWGPGKTVVQKGPRVKEIPQAPSEPPPRPPPQARYGLTEPPTSPPPRPGVH